MPRRVEVRCAFAASPARGYDPRVPAPSERYRYVTVTTHAAEEMERRAISISEVMAVLAAHEQEIPVRPGRVVVQGLQGSGGDRPQYVLRVVVDVEDEPPTVVTVYRSSKIRKYWRES